MHKNSLKYFILYKPYGMLSQFKSEGANRGIETVKFPFPKDVYPVGRLDSDSEGLLLLTNDTKINYQLLDPVFKHKRTYFAQVEGNVEEEKLEELRKGLVLNIKGKMHTTAPCSASIIKEPVLPERNPPIRFRNTIPTTWLSITITEGKYHQVRKMTAKIGYPTLRLVRYSIEKLLVEGLAVEQVLELTQEEAYAKLLLKK
ncbi:MAG: pseudouridine synthase [Bacteroidetes bacterium]|nr:pseudouridine synthase [Bacteroidota bacterium]